MKLTRLSTGDGDFDQALTAVLAWDTEADGGVGPAVSEILAAVRADGDAALLELTARFDRLTAASVPELEITRAEMDAALAAIPAADRRALEQAGARITAYHERQLQPSWSFEDELGNTLGSRVTPIQRAGVYVPGGQASYPSSVLMTLLPARVAGVEELVVTVPTPDGVRNPMVIAALAIARPDRAYTIGGAQAVAALAYGTETIPRVDKVVGPGGAYVAEAKRQVFGHVGIDCIAGPSEILVIADGTTNPAWTALDLFSQAEHDADAQAILVSPDAAFVEAVLAEMQRVLPTLSRREIIEASLAARGAVILTADLEEAVRVANRIAPEHLELHVADAEALLPQVRHAGAIFCGPHAGESFGDYVAGPSHVLPTFGTARFASPLGVYDFQKRSSVISLSADGAAELADLAVPLAEREGLQAHARAAAVRAQQPPRE